MSSAPAPIDNLPIFNAPNFSGVPQSNNANKLNFPVAQGILSLPHGVTWGDGTYQNTATDSVENPMTSDLDGGGFSIINVDTFSGMDATLTGDLTVPDILGVVTINGSAYPPVVGSDNLTDVLTAGDDAGGLNITNLNQVTLSGTSTITDSTGDLVIQPPTGQTLELGSMTINNVGAIGIGAPADFGTTGKMLMSQGSLATPTWSAFPSLSIAVRIISPTYSNGVYYTSYAGTWNKSLYVSPTHGAGITEITQDVNNSFTGLYDIVNGIITIPAGYSGWWAINWNMSLARSSPSTTAMACNLGSGTSNSAFATNSPNVRSFLTTGTNSWTYNQFSTFAMSGIVYLPAGQTIAVWTNSVSQVNMGGDYSPANFRVSFLGF